MSDLAVRAARGSVNSMLVVGLFDGLACGVAYAVAGVPHAATWAAITGALAIVPFLGYVAVACTGAATGDGRRSPVGAVWRSFWAAPFSCAATRSCGRSSPATAFACASSGCSSGASAASRRLGSWDSSSVPSCSRSPGNCGSNAFAMPTLHQSDGHPSPNTDATAMVP